MTHQQLLKKYESLSANARRQVDALLASLTESDETKPVRPSRKVKPLRDEPFVGMWRDRTDMADSVAWVKSLRRSQWSHRIG